MEWGVLVQIAEAVGLSISVLCIIGVAWRLVLKLFEKIAE